MNLRIHTCVYARTEYVPGLHKVHAVAPFRSASEKVPGGHAVHPVAPPLGDESKVPDRQTEQPVLPPAVYVCAVSHNCLYYTSKKECAIPDDYVCAFNMYIYIYIYVNVCAKRTGGVYCEARMVIWRVWSTYMYVYMRVCM
jgi:hypothetical protein